MNRLFAGLLLLALFTSGTSCAATVGQSGMNAPAGAPGGQISVSYFYDHLSDDGQWFQDASLGWCWTPYDVAEDWRPYSDGHWEYTDYGWSWVSNESFGWATYHYGRWFFDDTYGWAWQPGTEWAPAWVAWRTGDDYIGWAPLPPVANWDASAGMTFSDADADAIPSAGWAFVPRQHLFDASLTLQVTSVARNVTLLGRSRDTNRYEVRSGRPANVGPDVAQFEATLGRPVPRVHIVDADSPARGNGSVDGNGAIGYFRPRVQVMPATHVTAPAMAGHRGVIPDAEMQRQRDERGRKLESDLAAERARLTQDHDAELRNQAPGVAADETQRRHAAEQQAFEAHATQARQVLSHRMEKQVIRPDKPGKPGKDVGNNGKPVKDKGNNGNNGRDKGNNGKDNGKGQ